MMMEYLCILNAFEQTYYNRIMELEKMTAAAASASASSSISTGGGTTKTTINGASSIAHQQQLQQQHQHQEYEQHQQYQQLQQLQHQHITTNGNNNNNINNNLNNNLNNNGRRQSVSSNHSSVSNSSSNGVGITGNFSGSGSGNYRIIENNEQNGCSANCLLWQPWRDFTSSAAAAATVAAAAAAAQHHRYFQHNFHYNHNFQKDSRLTTKELPTSKWRRDRRLRASEYSHSLASSVIASPPASPQMTVQQNLLKPLSESTNRSAINMIDSPIDMSVTSTAIKPRSPPPPYREPLPGSTYATSLARPSVITQAPPKRGDLRDSQLISNRENDNRSTESISMCETVIDEHFRRSLGADYVALFGKKSPTPSIPSPAPISTSPLPVLHHHRSTSSTPKSALSPKSPSPTTTPIPKVSPSPMIAHSTSESAYRTINQTNNDTIKATANQPTTPSPTSSALPTISSTTTPNARTSEPSVDDHFAKALGDTWKKLQADKKSKN